MSVPNDTFTQRLAAAARPLLGAPAVRFIAYLGLCAAYLQGGIVKLTDFPGAQGEMAQFGQAPAPLFAVLVIALEPGGSLMVLSGWLRWLGALGLAGFTLLVTGIALRYWKLPPGHECFMAANVFFEHLGLAGGCRYLTPTRLGLNFRSNISGTDSKNSLRNLERFRLSVSAVYENPSA